MSVPVAPLQTCALVSYKNGFANPGNVPHIGIYALCDPTDAVSAGIKMRVERCDGAGCVTLVFIGYSNGVQFTGTPAPQAEFIDIGLYGTIFKYRVRFENNDGNGPYSAIITIDTTIQGTSACDTGAITDFQDQVNSSGFRSSVESTLIQVQATGLRKEVEHTRAQVQATGLRIIYEYVIGPPLTPTINKTVDNTGPLQGSNVTWLIEVNNPDSNAVLAVSVDDLLPAGVTYVSHVASIGTYDPITGIWLIGDMIAGQTVTLSITTTVTGTGVITNTAFVHPGNNQDDATINVGHECPDLPLPLIFQEWDPDAEHKSSTCKDEL